MPSGSCFCGKIHISYSGQPALTATCHCLDCRKISGTMFSTNILVSEDDFQIVEGAPKAISKVADSGKTITSYFCSECGTTLFRGTESFPGMKIIKAGVLDGPVALQEASPAVELFVTRRPDWVAPFTGAGQKEVM
ncbi:Mss4-like protein [Dactylonectria estremocensis]|uniref:Mss4-like protein n=1 Tax=Dactylonectria estremocensis TaxID=1079267 RepID=A0A9P9D0F7_9HYPO|nr:Mss4-like protein [Dactylonectria estremocensis]